MAERIIRASEIGQYDYCARAWWLGSVQGVAPSNVNELQLGTRMHEQHGRVVARAALVQRGAIVLLIAGIILLAVFLITNGV